MALDALLAGLVTNFVTEAREHCERATREVMALESPDGTPEDTARRYDTLSRSLHSLKGSSAMLGLTDLAEVAHDLEDLVAPLRKALAPLTSGNVDEILQRLDGFMQQLRATAEGGAAAAPETEAPQAPIKTDPPREAEADAEDGSWRVGTRQVMGLMREVERLREVRLRLDERRREVDRCLAAVTSVGVATASGLELQQVRMRLGAISRSLLTDSEETSDIIGSLEDGLKSICTLPVRTVLDPLQRIMRDLCRSSGKRGRLSFVGDEISLDRRVLESLKSPLVQLVRNAVDHGIESPEQREGRGKHAQGVVVIRVEKQANLLFVEVSDDGNGIDLGRVREKALELRLATAEAVAAMPPHELHRMLFRSGFTTRGEVSDTSGRGVGLDVVRNQVEALEGRLEVESTAGQGTRFMLMLPAELGSSPVLQLRVGEHLLGLPMVAVETIVRSQKDRRRVMRARVQIEFNEQLLTLADLGALLGLRHPISPEDDMPVLIVHSQGKRLAVLADEILGDNELVIRPLPREIRDVPAYQGAATLARGELLLILRPDWLVDEVRTTQVERRGQRRALVVDDSLTVRALHRTMLEAGGYEVHTASGAQQALEHLGNATYDVVICDVAMEGMDGVAFTAALRARRDTRLLPIILVSAHDSDAHRERGLAAGADGFLSKRDCAAGRLLSEVSHVIGERAARPGGGA